jgi:hypothetical protein
LGWVFHMQVIVVSRVSATHLVDEVMDLYANHVDICKPKDKGDNGYRKVLQILVHVMK